MAHDSHLAPHGRDWSTDAVHGQHKRVPELEDQ